MKWRGDSDSRHTLCALANMINALQLIPWTVDCDESARNGLFKVLLDIFNNNLLECRVRCALEKEIKKQELTIDDISFGGGMYAAKFTTTSTSKEGDNNTKNLYAMDLNKCEREKFCDYMGLQEKHSSKVCKYIGRPYCKYESLHPKSVVLVFEKGDIDNNQNTYDIKIGLTKVSLNDFYRSAYSYDGTLFISSCVEKNISDITYVFQQNNKKEYAIDKKFFSTSSNDGITSFSVSSEINTKGYINKNDRSELENFNSILVARSGGKYTDPNQADCKAEYSDAIDEVKPINVIKGEKLGSIVNSGASERVAISTYNVELRSQEFITSNVSGLRVYVYLTNLDMSIPENQKIVTDEVKCWWSNTCKKIIDD